MQGSLIVTNITAWQAFSYRLKTGGVDLFHEQILSRNTDKNIPDF